MTHDIYVAELQRLNHEQGGILPPEKVVQAAKPPLSVLHPYFEWNEGTAADNFRLWQARQLLRIVVRYEPRVGREVRVFVSLSTDRVKTGGGYRELITVLKKPNLRAQLLTDAIAELQRMRQRYADLRELAAVFAEIDKL